MSLVLQISDTHFGTEVPAVVEALFALTRQLAPDLLVLSGDLTQRAKPAEFLVAKAFVQRLGVPNVVALPGNHDIPLYNLVQRMLAPYANFQRCFGPELEPSFESDDLLVLGVNTTRNYFHKDGRVSAKQIERVGARLARARPEQLRVVVTHQPIWVSRPRDRKDILRNHEAALLAWSRAGADLVLGGHIHLPYSRALGEAVPGLPRNVWCVQAGTATSARVRWDAPNSLNLIRHVPGATCAGVERWDFDASEARFVRSEQLELALSRR